MSESRDQLRRSDFGYFVSFSTQGFDHSKLFDSVINTYLVENCGQNLQTSPIIGLSASIRFQILGALGMGPPRVFDYGLRVIELGDSSVTAFSSRIKKVHLFLVQVCMAS
ncbi:hypothetical protein VKT23_013737 [Stygiomarasmius scandens]|uniref:Uncharacterized protein n=1 Tax=Marasmiellus scandens TaxID=2682957 RepID=A0ABR1J7G6_9AGAR